MSEWLAPIQRRRSFQEKYRRSRTVIGIDGYIFMREITGPDGCRLCPSPQLDPDRDFALLHHALAVLLLVVGIAAAVFRDPDIVQIQVKLAHVEISDSCVSDRRQNASQIGVRSEECRLD